MLLHVEEDGVVQGLDALLALGGHAQVEAYPVISFAQPGAEPEGRFTWGLWCPEFQGDRAAIARRQLSSFAPLLSNYEFSGLEGWGAVEKFSGREHSFDELARSAELSGGTHAASRISRQSW